MVLCGWWWEVSEGKDELRKRTDGMSHKYGSDADQSIDVKYLIQECD